MKQIKIKYYPVGWLKLAFSAKGAIPESWDETTPKQIVALGCAANNSIGDVAFIAALTGIRKWVIKRLDNYQRFQLSEQLGFLSTSTLHNTFVIKQVTVGLVKYYAPKPKLKGMSFGQFIFVDSLFGSYQHEQSADELHRFLAALLLRNRKQFTEDCIEQNAPVMAKLKPDVKEALVINYLLVKKWLVKSYPLVFPEPEETPESKKQEPPTYDPMAWAKIFENLRGDDLAHEEKYSNLPVHTALRYITQRIKENIKRKK
ncbi:hypothetical protein OU798_07365 [Prolixibacteraceae bacterium Z1-6]|uniref:Uncharacterized protein n=1 Tax=Draconibacterium aestuarii TaxID=2998507 RepID=A0A9X3FC31_9BACT|nr:hypothetical protein [Prolixibacteraceae bacterium Z1-6]